jgi:hypothetical protein
MVEEEFFALSFFFVWIGNPSWGCHRILFNHVNMNKKNTFLKTTNSFEHSE